MSESKSPQDGDLFFAYGTLKQGGEYHYLLANEEAVQLGTGSLKVPYPLVLAEYPCLLDQPGSGHRVKGEVYRIPLARNWEKLDWLEGHPEEYQRRLEEVELVDRIVQAWTYFYLPAKGLDPELPWVDEFPAAD